MKNRKILIIGVIFLIAYLIISILIPNLNFITNDNNLNSTEEKFNVPILGEISAKNVSLPLFSMIIGAVDGFNPCAMWILIFLITMLITMEDHRKRWILGITFIATSGFVYLLFMVSWLNLAIFFSKVIYLRMFIAVLALIFGMVNIDKYLKERNKDEIGCEVTNDETRGKIVTKIKKITTEKRFILAIVGIMILAISVNILELLCSLGLPVIFTQVLALNNLSLGQYIFYFSIYIFFFLLDDILVFIIAVKTLNIKGISNKYTKYSHLIGGIIMLIIGLLMALKPEWLMFNF